ncbi:uncharacterized protein LOC116259440 [Nymphaea colorata]|nr:uncharacterized protein LOC116259440 [Nymphaea colorata]
MSSPPCTVPTLKMSSVVPICRPVLLRRRRPLRVLQNSVSGTKFLDTRRLPYRWEYISKYESFSPRGLKRAASVTNRQTHYTFEDDESEFEPFWSFLIKETYRYLRSLLQFLVDQPGELRYLEWPSFKSTLKTAILTLVLVALLIVALSSIDAALWYLLALILRRAA